MTILALDFKAAAFFTVRFPRSWLATAAQYFIVPRALINERPKGNLNLMPLIGKFSIALWV